MKQLMKKFGSRATRISTLIFMLYTIFVILIRVMCEGGHSKTQLALICLGTLLLTVAGAPLLMWLLSRCDLHPRTQQKTADLKNALVNAGFYLVPVTVFLLYFIACFPGGFSVDSFDQYAQAISDQYNDWHPVLHTLLAFKLPLTLSGGWVGSIVLLQVLCYSGVIGYTGQVIRKHFGIAPAIIAVALTLLNPLVMLTSMHPWKDSAFAVCTLLLATYSLQVIATKGTWLNRSMNLTCFAVVAVVASIIRHNGILFTAPLVLGVALCLSRKRALALCLSVMLLFAAVKFPIYSLLNVEAPDKRQIETLGLPMTVIDAVAVTHPELLDEETLTFVYQVTPKEVLEAEYKAGSFNSVKFKLETNLDVIEQYGTGKVLTFMLRCFKAAPKTAIKSVVDLTGRLFLLDKASTGFVYPRVGVNDYGIEQTPNMTLITLFKSYAEWAQRNLAKVFLYLGIQHWILLAFILARVKLKRRFDWTKLLVVLSVPCYNFGSGLLLSCWMDIFRFFFFTFPVMPVMLLVLCCSFNAQRSKNHRPLFQKQPKK